MDRLTSRHGENYVKKIKINTIYSLEPFKCKQKFENYFTNVKLMMKMFKTSIHDSVLNDYSIQLGAQLVR